MQLLVLDDSDMMRNIIVKTLLAAGLEDDEIHQAANGVQALRLLNSESFDVLLLDIVMDGVDGISVLKEARVLQPKARVIMCSTFSKIETVKELIDIGIHDFVVKPFSAERLKEAVLKQRDFVQ
ncbi:MAG: response regulator receiver protein [Firmicutes bacterium]|nr:response regulator receiver protein [Bacillota bacterium]